VAQSTLSNLHFGLNQIGSAEEDESPYYLLSRLDVLKLCPVFSVFFIYNEVLIIIKKKYLNHPFSTDFWFTGGKPRTDIHLTVGQDLTLK
jgi:hypothetical protein